MSENGKPKFAMYWAAACGGCEIAVLNTGEKILDVDAAFDVAFWPVAMDAKYADLEALPDGAITLTLFDGGIRNEENEHVARVLRRKSKILVAFGSCACEGCIPGLANLSPVDQILDTAFHTVSTDNPDDRRPQARFDAPEGELRLPRLEPLLRPLDQVVPVDYYLPGCPPESHQIAAVIDLVIKALRGEAQLPPPGSTIGAGDSTVCDECPRARHVKHIREFRRIQDLDRADPTLCLLEQGIPCNGPATRSGCGALCPQAGAQCIGCYGPAEGVADMGARLMTAFASVIDSRDPDEIDAVLDTLPDPVGQFYRFSLPGSLLRGARAAATPLSPPPAVSGGTSRGHGSV
jgi:F420-non-reducing hydrogenase small subunit